MNRIFCTLLLFTAMLLTGSSASAKDRDKAIYAFGYGTCLGDTVVYLSDIQVLDSATINRKSGFLEQRERYSHTMEQILRQLYHKHFTCTIFYADSKSRLEKQYVNLKKHLNKDKSVRMELLAPGSIKLSSAPYVQ